MEFEGKKLLPFIFAKVGGIGKLLQKITSLTFEDVDEVTIYKKYFPKNNI